MTVNDAYFAFLLKKVKDVTHIKLCKLLYQTEFIFPNNLYSDSNRANDGIELRYEFAVFAAEGVNNVAADESLGYLLERPCTVLEMLVALAIRIDRDITGEPGVDNAHYWFEKMLENLGIANANDNLGKYVVEMYTKPRIDIFLNRKYDSNGRGGLFPVKNIYRDQRTIGIWEQMSDYLNESEKEEQL